jgi:lipoprotein signal peptidase
MLNCGYFLYPYISFRWFIIASLFLLLVFSYIFLKTKNKKVTDWVGFGLVIAGSAPNFYFRITQACVPDNLSLHNLVFFNFSDIIIVLGLLIFAGGVLYGKKSTDNRR